MLYLPIRSICGQIRHRSELHKQCLDMEDHFVMHRIMHWLLTTAIDYEQYAVHSEIILFYQKSRKQ